MSEDGLQDLLARHTAFWRRQAGKPLMSVTQHRPLEDRGGIPLADGSRALEGALITPDLLEPDRFYNAASPITEVVRGDFLACEGPPGMCWTEAAFGCPVRIVPGGPWADPVDDDRLTGRPIAPDSRWIDKLEAFVDYLVERAAGRYPIVQPLMRGPVDMMFAGLGHEQACLLTMTDPAASDRVLDACADLFIEMATRRLACTPLFEGGYLSGFGIWAPEKVVGTQADNASLLSPESYRERVLPYDRRVFESFEYTLIHLHSCCLHVVDDLLKEDALDCIQVSIDYPGGPLAAEVMPVLERILEAKPLIVTGPVYASELGRLERLEPSGGLCLQVQVVPDDEEIM